MKRGDIEVQLTTTNQWWRATGGDWAERDRDLRRVAEAPIVYRPDPLREVEPPGLYMLLGPRRVGKSVELKRKVENLIEAGVPPRRIVHAACDGWRAGDLGLLVNVADELAPPDDGPRFFFIDEVTAITDDWVSRIKWLRDNTSLDGDCVVLSGSSSADLEKAAKLLAGRRQAGAPHRTLLPMGFDAFVRALGIQLPHIEPIPAGNMLRPEADEAISELRVHLNDLVPAWERYLQVGGFPRAVSDWVSNREVSNEFLGDLWDVVHGDALASEEWGELQTEQLLDLLAGALSSFFNVDRAAREVVVHHETIKRRLLRLRQAYIAWDCHRLENGQPRLQAQRKIYFVDPLYARLTHLRTAGRRFAPDFTQLTEQQVGVALRAQYEADRPGSFGSSSTLFHEKTRTGKEIDFVAPWLQGLPYEGKYTEGSWLRDAQTAATAYGRCVLATRSVIERRDGRRAVAAPILSLLLDRRGAHPSEPRTPG